MTNDFYDARFQDPVVEWDEAQDVKDVKADPAPAPAQPDAALVEEIVDAVLSYQGQGAGGPHGAVERILAARDAQPDAALSADGCSCIEYLRRFPPTDQQQPGIDAAIAWLEIQPTAARADQPTPGAES